NPYSDPTEEIFLRNVADLKYYWPIRERLQKEYPGQNPLDALDTALIARTKPNEALIKIAEALGVKPDTGEIIKAVMDLAEDTKIADAVKKALKDGKYIDEEQKDALKGTDLLIDDAKVKQKIAQMIKDAKPPIKGDTTEEAAKNALLDREAMYATLTE